MWYFLVFILGVCYSLVVIYFAFACDKQSKEMDILFTKKQTRFFALICFLWPITMFFPRLWNIK